MKVKTLQENLRKALWKRIEAGEITGLKLADLTGFKQAHISNFLNRKRSLSIEGFDNLLGVSRLSVLDLLDSNEVNKRASILPRRMASLRMSSWWKARSRRVSRWSPMRP